MAHYIVYSGGAQGYRLYAADAEFPEEYREPIEKLYAARCVATNHSVIPRCYRFSPIKDRYVFSVIYKGCVCEGESRSFFATVNFLLTTKEADSFWGHFKHDVAMLIEKADEILLKEGYSIPRPTPIISEYRDKITVTAQQALLSAAHYAMLAGSLPKNELSAQVFLGCEQEDDLFSPVCWLSNVIPKHMRRHISFHIGAFVAEETRDVSLVVSYNERLQEIAAGGSYSGTMAVKKVLVVNDEYRLYSKPVSGALAYLRLSQEQKRRLNKLFLQSDCCGGFWHYIAALDENNTENTKGAALAILMGERGFTYALKNDVFSEEELLEIYSGKKRIPATWEALQLLEERVAPIKAALAEKEQSAETNETVSEEPEQEECKEKHSCKKTAKEKVNLKEVCKTFFKKCGKGICLAWHTALPFLFIGLSWLLPVALGVGMFFLGLLGVKVLPQQFLWAAYGIQIAVLLLLAIPLGYFAISLTQRQIVRWRDGREKQEKEKEKAE